MSKQPRPIGRVGTLRAELRHAREELKLKNQLLDHYRVRTAMLESRLCKAIRLYRETNGRGGAMNHAKKFLDDLADAFASLDDRRREAEDMLHSDRRYACIACGEPLTAGTVEVLPVIDLRHCTIWMVAVHLECAERYGDVLADVIQRKMDGEAAH